MSKEYKDEQDECCALCEFAHKICGGEYFVCSKKGVVPPDHACRRFTLDPLKLEVSPTRFPAVPDAIFH